MNTNQQRIWDYLILNTIGIQNAVHISRIAEELNIPPKGTNNDDVRRWIKEMVVTHHLPIGTCDEGVFYL